MTDLRKLAEAARAAETAPYDASYDVAFEAFDDAFSPDVVLGLLDERDKLALHVEELRDKFTGETCACSYDEPGDVCCAHSPAVKRITAERDRLREALTSAARELELLYNFAISRGVPEAEIPPHVAARAALKEGT